MRGGLLLLLLLMAKARMVSVDGSKNMRILVNEDPGHELVDLCALTLLIVYPCLLYVWSKLQNDQNDILLRLSA